MSRVISKTTADTPTQVFSAGLGDDIFGKGAVRWFVQNGIFVVPQNVSQLRVTVIGGGGGGATGGPKGKNDTGNCFGGGGGGAGGTAIKIIDVEPGQLFNVTVGTGGVGGTYTDDDTLVTMHGQDGGTSSFGSEVSATGGGGGICASPLAPTTGKVPGSGGVGGNGVGGDVNIKGGNGGNSIIPTDLSNKSVVGGFGGGGASFGGGDGGDGCDAPNDSGQLLSGGGGGTGGKGAKGLFDPTNTTASTQTVFGGGSGGDGTKDAPGPNISGKTNGTESEIYTFASRTITFTAFRGCGATRETKAGTGGGGSCIPTTNVDEKMAGGLCGGGAGGSSWASVRNIYAGGPGGFPGGGAGGGSSGGIANLSSCKNPYGVGGGGVVIVEW